MEQKDKCSWISSRKRKLEDEDERSVMSSMDELHEDLLERVLSWLPTSAFFRLSSVCKRWKSVADSASFKLACSAIPSRDPWFFMVDPHLNQSTIFDSAEKNWKKLNYSPLLQSSCNRDSIPVASSGGLVCFRNDSGNFIVSNPVTGLCREIPPVESPCLHAIAMSTSSTNQQHYELILISGELPKLSSKVYSSSTNCWTEEVFFKRMDDESQEFDSSDDNAVYFLSKSGNLVAADMQRSPSKQFSSVITVKDGEEIVYFLSSLGTIIACNLARKSFSEYPRLLPVLSEYSIDVVESRGEMLVAVLSEFFESASLRIWRFDEGTKSWQQVVAMPPAMSHQFYGKKMDINCVGAGDQIFVCLNSTDFFSYVMCDVRNNKWTELPKCFVNGEAVEFMSAFSFEPRIEASV